MCELNSKHSLVKMNTPTTKPTARVFGVLLDEHCRRCNWIYDDNVKQNGLRLDI